MLASVCLCGVHVCACVCGCVCVRLGHQRARAELGDAIAREIDLSHRGIH